MIVYVIYARGELGVGVKAVETDPKKVEKLTEFFEENYISVRVEERDTDDNVCILNGDIPYCVNFYGVNYLGPYVTVAFGPTWRGARFPYVHADSFGNFTINVRAASREEAIEKAEALRKDYLTETDR